MQNYLKKTFVSLTLTVILFAQASFAGQQEANKFVGTLSDNVLSLLKDESTSNADKEERLTKLFKKHVNTKWMGSFVLGKYLRQIKPEEKQKFFDLYEEYLLKSYVPKFREYDGDAVEIVRVQDAGKNQYTVVSKIKSNANAPEIRVDYRLLEKDGDFKIIDLVGEGVSLITTQRSDFAGLISRKGINVFIEKLEDKVIALRKETGTKQ